MERRDHLRFAVALVALLAVAPVEAADSTSAPHPSMSWQAPLARGPSGGFDCPSGSMMTATGNGSWACADTVANAANATTAGYANGAGTADALLPANIPTCPTGYALSGVTGAWTCVSNVNAAGYATTSGNGVAGVSGNTLTTTAGTNYTLPAGGGGGTYSCPSVSTQSLSGVVETVCATNDLGSCCPSGSLCAEPVGVELTGGGDLYTCTAGGWLYTQG